MTFGDWYWNVDSFCHYMREDGTKVICPCNEPEFDVMEIIRFSNIACNTKRMIAFQRFMERHFSFNEEWETWIWFLMRGEFYSIEEDKRF